MDPSGEPLQETNRAPRDQNIHRTQHCESIQEKERQMNWNDIAVAVYFNSMPVLIVLFGFWIIIESVIKKESGRKNK